MSRDSNVHRLNGGSAAAQEVHGEFVTLRLCGQTLGIPVMAVHDVLAAQKITPIPLAPYAVAGVLNLRGRIVTAIDLRARLGLPPRGEGDACMSIVVEHKGEPYSLLIDSVGEVLTLTAGQYERNPVTLDTHWQLVSNGIYRLDGELLVVVDVERLLDIGLTAVA
ncbi:chemotaxis protein CheW [Govanella unica]|uniref:Chemotaxis protein CheW n=1 Tax=Govanella unica TaxID=2975056 RepID=A0A9X3TWS1_9PROT|nr:chemotaxis protein CheW [Govania unica]MDA5193166.1 chemotaxis protein CheW [Govania unica]